MMKSLTTIGILLLMVGGAMADTFTSTPTPTTACGNDEQLSVIKKRLDALEKPSRRPDLTNLQPLVSGQESIGIILGFTLVGAFCARKETYEVILASMGISGSIGVCFASMLYFNVQF